MTIANAKPDLLITGPIGTTTVNAASSAWHDYLTVEAKITAAIAYAVSIGAKYCYVPDSFLPYTASLVTFNPAVRMTREGSNPEEFDVRAYGAAGDNPANATSGTNDSAAFTAAITGALAITTGSTVIVRVPAGNYLHTSAWPTITGPVLIWGSPGNASKVTFNGTGTFLTWNRSAIPAGLYNHVYGDGLRDLYFAGPGSGTATTGALWGGTGSAEGTFCENVQWEAWGTGCQLANNAFTQAFLHCLWFNNGQHFNIPVGLTNTGESINFLYCTFASSTAFVTSAVTCNLAVNNLSFFGCSFDNAQYTQSAGQTHFAHCHWENPSGTTTTNPYFSMSAGTVCMIAQDFEQDTNTATLPAAFIAVSGGTLATYGNGYFNASGTPIANCIALSGTGSLFEHGTKLASGITGFVANTSSGFLATYGNVWGNNQVNGAFSVNNGVRPGTPALAYQTGNIFQGSGVPSNTNGNNGDIYFRTDTPGTANQRMYIKSAGSWLALTL
jgi:hypothetical protein